MYHVYIYLLLVANNPEQGIFLVGRKEGDQSLQMQLHYNISRKDKISVVCNHPKPDLNMSMYVFEYGRDFDRLNTSLKITNQEISVSACTALYKNTFIGMEVVSVVLYIFKFSLKFLDFYIIMEFPLNHGFILKYQ